MTGEHEHDDQSDDVVVVEFAVGVGRERRDEVVSRLAAPLLDQCGKCTMEFGESLAHRIGIEGLHDFEETCDLAGRPMEPFELVVGYAEDVGDHIDRERRRKAGNDVRCGVVREAGKELLGNRLDPGFVVLQMEFTLYALRNPANRTKLADHQRQWRDVIESVVRADCERLGVEPPMPVEDAAEMILAMDNGYVLSEMIEPGSYKPGTFSRNILMLQQLFQASIEAGNKTSEQ